MRKKIVSGLLAVALVFTSVPTNVIALGAGGNTDRHNISMTNPFADLVNGNNNSEEQSTSSTNTSNNPFADLVAGNSSDNSSDDTSNDDVTSNNTTNNPFADLVAGNSNNNSSDDATSNNTSNNPFADLVAGNSNNSNDDTSNDDVTSDNTSNNPFADLVAGNSNNNTTDDTSKDDDTSNDDTSNDTSGNLFEDLVAGNDNKDEEVQGELEDTVNDANANANADNDNDNEVATLVEPIANSASWIAIDIDTSFIDATNLKFNSSITSLKTGVDVANGLEATSQIYNQDDSNVEATSFFNSLFGFFKPMSISYNTNQIVANILNAKRVELLSNSVGYFSTGGTDFSKLTPEDAVFYYEYTSGTTAATLTYDSSKTGIANFETGYLPVFDPSTDFTGAPADMEFTGWKFDNNVTVSIASSDYGAKTFSNISQLPLSTIENADSVTVPLGTTITAMFSNGTIYVDGLVKHTDKDFTDYTTLTATLYDDGNQKIEEVKVGQNGSYEFTTGINPGYYYHVVVTGGSDIEDSESYDFLATDTDMTLNTIYVEYVSDQYKLTYYELKNNDMQPVDVYYEVGDIVALEFDDDFHSYLENTMLIQWTGWKINPDVEIILSSKSTLVFKMPAYNVEIQPDYAALSDGYTVYFNSDGKTEKTVTSLQMGSKISYYSPSSRLGYEFTGWYTNSACTIEWDFDTEISASHFDNNNEKILYAGWVGNIVNVVINYDGSIDNSGQLTSVQVGKSYTINAGTKDGSSFSNWTWSNDKYSYSMSSYATPNTTTSTIYLEIPPLDEDDTLTILANWEPLYARVYVNNIIDSYDDGDSAYVYIYNSNYGTLIGEYIGNTTAGDEAYYFDLEDYGTGMYTVEVVSRTSNQEMTTVMYIEDTSSHAYVTLLPEDKYATVTNTATNVLNVGSTNLNEMFTSSELTSTDTVTIDMQVKSVTSSNADALLILDSITDNQAIGLFLDVSLLKTIGSTKYQMYETPNSKGLNVTVQLPDGFKNQKSYFVSTVHNGTFSTLSSSQVIYDASTNTIKFNATEFSVFGIGYSGTSGSSLVGTSIPTDAGYDIPLFQNVVLGQYIEGLGKYVLVHPDSTNWSFAGWYHGVTLEPLSANELVSFIVTETILTNGIYPRFVQVDEYGNPLTSPVPQTGILL